MIGKNRFFAFKSELFPLIVNKFFALFLFSFESNIRWTTIISATGVLGIGLLINDGLQNPVLGWKIIGIPLLVLLFLSMLIEFLLLFFNKFIFCKKSLKVAQKNKFFLFLRLNYDRIIKFFFIFLVLILLIFSIFEIKNWTINFAELKTFFNSLFLFDSKIFALGKLDNPAYMILSLSAQVVVAAGIIMVFSLFFAILANEKLNNFLKSFSFKFLLNFFRVIPTIIFFYLFVSFSLQPILLVAVLIGFNGAILMAKKLNETINSLDFQKCKSLKLQNWQKWKIIFYHILPLISSEYWKYLNIEISNSVHNLLLFGILGGSLLGQKISVLSQSGITGSKIGFFSYSWIAWSFIMIIEIALAFLEKNYFKKFYKSVEKIQKISFFQWF
ncbi:ABC transporter permease subunit [Mycoplasma sp. 'Moose RK']|uniref:ABC transporter permease subunit n=1 Tax=Mycoplasma sp. 'Moose RK' TaxID=2780095 RepID=UPI0018C23EAB|nr:ABC transporter permease subunit [Mycoplasma sp. 'Moose RK']MBG0730673.1 ABC transporter permease subunit [Mycoplasma sp. 'Moose RK']